MRTCALLIVAASAGVVAQAPSGPTFDVVSIKKHVAQPGPAGFSSNVNIRPDGGFTMTNIRIVNLIARVPRGGSVAHRHRGTARVGNERWL